MTWKQIMGFFDKLKSFGSKIVRGIRKGWDFVKTRVAPVVRKILPVAKQVAPAFGPKGAAVSQGIDTGEKVMSALGL